MIRFVCQQKTRQHLGGPREVADFSVALIDLALRVVRFTPYAVLPGIREKIARYDCCRNNGAIGDEDQAVEMSPVPGLW